MQVAKRPIISARWLISASSPWLSLKRMYFILSMKSPAIRSPIGETAAAVPGSRSDAMIATFSRAIRSSEAGSSSGSLPSDGRVASSG